MARRQVISTGKDVASAIIRGLNELGRRRDQVDVTVLQKPSKGFLGIGAKKARVQIVEKAWDSEHSTPMRTGIKKRSTTAYIQTNKKPRRTRRPHHLVEKSVTLREPKANEAQKLPSMEIQKAIIPEEIKQPMEDAKNALNGILNKMGIKISKLNAWWDAKQERILLTFDCDSPALVIGKEAKTLQALQYLITLMISRSFSSPISVVADTQNYWNKIEEKLNKDITYALATIRRNKRPYRFRPMSAQMRRYIHHFLALEEDIMTVSEGEGKWRKVVIKIVKPEDKLKQGNSTQVSSDITIIENKTETPAAETKAQDSCVVTAESTNCSSENTENMVNENIETNTTTPVEENIETKPVTNETVEQTSVNTNVAQKQTPEQPAQTVQPAQTTEQPTQTSEQPAQTTEQPAQITTVNSTEQAK